MEILGFLENSNNFVFWLTLGFALVNSLVICLCKYVFLRHENFIKNVILCIYKLVVSVFITILSSPNKNYKNWSIFYTLFNKKVYTLVIEN